MLPQFYDIVDRRKSWIENQLYFLNMDQMYMIDSKNACCLDWKKNHVCLLGPLNKIGTSPSKDDPRVKYLSLIWNRC